MILRRWPQASCRLHQVGTFKRIGVKGRSLAAAFADAKAEESKQASDAVEKITSTDKQPPPASRNIVRKEVDQHIKELRKQSEKAIASEKSGSEMEDKFCTDWREHPGHQVPYRFRIQERPPKAEEDSNTNEQTDKKRPTRQNSAQKKDLPYSDFVGLRFPTLETAENYDYHKYRGLDRVVEHSFPIRVPGYRRLDPYLREYIYFLHDLDPARFTVARIAERYRLRESTVAKVVQEWGVNRYITRSGLSTLREKQRTREAVILDAKEQQYAKWVGYDQLGDEDKMESDDEALGEYKGFRSTNDWVRKQNVEVEMMSAFPMMAKRDPMPKRVDVDLVVDTREKMKVINWIDPTDKVVF